MYTTEEALGRLLLLHCEQGKPIHSFDWRDYVAQRSAGLRVAQQWFVPDAAVHKIAEDIVQHAAFIHVVVQEKSHKRGSAALEWSGYQLQKGEGRAPSMLLAPFEPRLTKEESAVRLALEASRFRIRWDFLANRKVQNP